ncbi:uncharacterized protein PHACADRAFT_251077 [Phanerochaete carnosa HHB-10118-sp]|uniref:Uncharacterized protein n=1 Tax=Phanerochaete carnosa (strain HHB-10118-sp) TaxID=650164 RepID=K5X3P3_PHACS|nr:uncharacterized protein PHACADRAFT_251077 [Phanerochaete carnosa HHB-10118-sp]EKM57422.1 hypothetical protein PHACADRAFT_251077 [Phanerochaete carnosa HHB-10118-sp]
MPSKYSAERLVIQVSVAFAACVIRQLDDMACPVYATTSITICQRSDSSQPMSSL